MVQPLFSMKIRTAGKIQIRLCKLLVLTAVVCLQCRNYFYTRVSVLLKFFLKIHFILCDSLCEIFQKLLITN